MIDRVVIVDDEFMIRQFMEESIRRLKIDVLHAASGEEAIEVLRSEEVQMAFVDMRMGKLTGMDVLRFRNKHCPNVFFVIMTAYSNLETATEAMQLGAFDFLIKPFSPDQTAVVIEKARRWHQLTEQQGYLQRQLQERRGPPPIIGHSPVMEKVLNLSARVAPTQATVLITGESGTGKELVANEIHRQSDPNTNRPYIRMNCAAVPENLLESELFGHEKGAFTGAISRRVGRFELADGGTLLLDEIGEISPAMQAKLLRILQESEFERVGGTKTVRVNVRVVATTNRDLKAEVERGTFREDLYYRLNVFPIHLPPLRERGDDVGMLANAFLERQATQLRRSLHFTTEALQTLCAYGWPGNVREMGNVIERVAILEDGPAIPRSGLPADINHPNPGHHPEIDDELFNLRKIERRTIQRALEKTSGNRTLAADLLGFSVRTLRNKLKEPDQEADPPAPLADNRLAISAAQRG